MTPRAPTLAVLALISCSEALAGGEDQIVSAALQLSSNGGSTLSTQASQASQASRTAGPAGDCGQGCPDGFACERYDDSRAWCVDASARHKRKPAVRRQPDDCPSGMVCEVKPQSAPSAECAGVAAPPPTSLLAKGFDLYLRPRAIQLREELALGRGPLIAAIADSNRVEAAHLGRVLRLHREELVALIGDGSGRSWVGLFLQRTRELEPACAHT